MTAWFLGLGPVAQALVAGLFTLGVTAVGAGLVAMDRFSRGPGFGALLGFAAGVMLAASFWSLLDPAIALAEAQGGSPWFPPMVGVVTGAVFLGIADRVLPHLHPGLARSEAEGPRTAWSTTTLLILAITLHNIPEGLAVGVAFGAAANPVVTGSGAGTIGGAVALALGIAIQNFPEGAAVALPLRAAGLSRRTAFLAGAMSAAVEPVAAVGGAFAVGAVSSILPYALAFAAGAMIFVVIEELIPAAQRQGGTDLSTVGAMAGFTVMMVLDVALG
jgi:ZIP family zinc transporter